MRALADRLGKHTAHDAVYAAAMTGLDLGQDFRTALRGEPRLDPISDGELDGLLEVRASLGSCAAFVDRVRLACARQPANQKGDQQAGPVSGARR
jgi:adenylosuccinate lyase